MTLCIYILMIVIAYCIGLAIGAHDNKKDQKHLYYPYHYNGPMTRLEALKRRQVK